MNFENKNYLIGSLVVMLRVMEQANERRGSLPTKYGAPYFGSVHYVAFAHHVIESIHSFLNDADQKSVRLVGDLYGQSLSSQIDSEVHWLNSLFVCCSEMVLAGRQIECNTLLSDLSYAIKRGGHPDFSSEVLLLLRAFDN